MGHNIWTIEQNQEMAKVSNTINVFLTKSHYAFLTNSDFNFIAPIPSILQSIL